MLFILHVQMYILIIPDISDFHFLLLFIYLAQHASNTVMDSGESTGYSTLLPTYQCWELNLWPFVERSSSSSDWKVRGLGMDDFQFVEVQKKTTNWAGLGKPALK